MTTTKVLQKIDKAHVLESTLRKMLPHAKEIRVRGYQGFDVELEDGLIFQAVKEDYGVSFYIEEKPPQFLLSYEIAGEAQRKIFLSDADRTDFIMKLPESVEFTKSDID